MLTRRNYLKLMALSPLALSMPNLANSKEAETQKSELIVLSEELLSEWCRGLLTYQINKPGNPLEHGGIWSPGDGRILGRCADAIYPFMWYAKKHQDERFIDSADKLMNWSIQNMSYPDGSWKNEFKDKWNGITVFTAIAMAQTLFYYGDILDSRKKQQWYDRLEKTAQWLYKTINLDFGNINYPVSNCFAMALLGRLLQKPEYTSYGSELAHGALKWFTQQDNFLFGEGRDNKKFPSNMSAKGCYPIDLGYNVEESLPMLTLYGLLENDEKVLNQVIYSLKTHLYFMLPDGGWDNSWGIRNYKWTWWGSRTTDGCQPAYGLLADKDPAFLEAAFRNTNLLKRNTVNGILQGGPHLYIRNLPASIHHTFCHAKGLVSMLNIGIPLVSKTESSLPCEKSYGVRYFPDIATQIISLPPWRATITNYDFPDKHTNASHPSGGALSLLWHKDIGPLITASMTKFSRIEQFDMQVEDGPDFGVLTPRIELKYRANIFQKIINRLIKKDSTPKTYMNILDFGATLESQQQNQDILVKTTARLVDEDQTSPKKGEVICKFNYLFSTHYIEIEVEIASPHFKFDKYDIEYIIPILSHHLEPVSRESDNIININKCNHIVRVSSNQTLVLPASLQSRIFSYVPGFEAIPIKIPIIGHLIIKIEILSI